MFFNPHQKLLSTILLAASVLIINPVAQAARPSPEYLDRISIIVNNEITTRSELEKRVQTARTTLQQRKIKLPPEAVLKRQVTDALILEQLQLQQAKKMGLEITDAQINSAIDRIARRNKLTRSEFLARTRRDSNISLKELKLDIGRQLTMRELVNRVIGRQVQVSEHEIDNFLNDRNRRNADQAFNLSHIIISVPPGAPASARASAAKEAGEIRKKIVAGSSFENLAITYSKGPNALKGGALGWRQAGQLPDLFVGALIKLQKGSITPVLESPNGFHILRVNNRRGGLTSKKVRQARVRHILFKPNTKRTAQQTRSALLDLRKRIIAGEDFAALAKKHSQDTGSAAQGGDLGWISRGQLVSEVESAIGALQPGETSQPVQSRFGFHLVQVISRRSKDTGNKQERMAVRQQIHSRKAEEKLQTWLLELRSQAYVEILSN